jgi:hypothetical protein
MTRKKGIRILIDLEQSEEIRDYVKELIRGQVASFTREEIKQIVAETLYKPQVQAKIANVEKIAEEEIRNYAAYLVRNAVGQMGQGFYEPRAIENIVRKRVEETLPEEQLRKIAEKIAAEFVRKFFDLVSEKDG